MSTDGASNGDTKTPFQVSDEEMSQTWGEAEVLNDKKDMHRMGRKDELKRNFDFLSSFGFSMLLGCSWEYALVTGGYVLAAGGTGGTIFLFLGASVGMFTVMLSMAELASMAPSSGAQYQWVSEFAPPKLQKFLSYQAGWASFLGWMTCTTLIAYLVSQQLQSIIALADSSYVSAGWQRTLLTIAVCVWAILFNLYFMRKIPIMEGLLLMAHIAVFFLIIIVLWVMGPRKPASEVFTDFKGTEGWSNVGVAVLASIGTPIVSLMGADSACYLAEEHHNAARVVPRCMIATAATNYALGFITIVTFMFVTGGIDEATKAVGGQTYVAVIYSATESKAATIVLTSFVAFMLIGCAVNKVTLASRQLYAFARDGGLPFSKWLCHVHPTWRIPVNAVMTTLFWTIVMSVIVIGSPNAYSIITALSLNGLCCSYLDAILVILYAKLSGAPLPVGRFSLGRRLGIFINTVAAMFLIIVFMFTFFPTHPDPQPSSFNWAILVTGSTVVFLTVFYYVYAQHHYTAPIERVRKDH